MPNPASCLWAASSDGSRVRQNNAVVTTLTNQLNDGLPVTFLRRFGALPLQCE